MHFISVIEKKAGVFELIPIEDKSKIAKEFSNELKINNTDYIRDLFQRYNVYVRSIIDSVKEILEKSLISKNYQLRISIALKLFNKIYEEGETHNSVKIITAFRDSKTYHEQKREIGKKEYRIDKNIDFQICLDREYFIKNNAGKNDPDYTNEHIDFNQYYNCTISVPIYTKYAEKKRFFGYLCCDVLNNDYENENIFDITEANIFLASAFSMAMFFDNINKSWKNMLDEHKNIDFNNYIHSVFFKNGGKNE
jgi:hypothetical protein